MSFSAQTQNPGHPPNTSNSTTVWTQPTTTEQKRYYSKHAGERRVFGWMTTILQTAHAAIAFAAWTAIYLWVFKAVPFMLPAAPFLAGVTLAVLHVLFRTTWQTYWYDRLDDDPNTDSPVWVPAAIFVLLIALEVQGAKQYLAGQVTPAEQKDTEHIEADHATTLASIEQAYRNHVASINDVYKAKTAPLDRQISAARSRSADNDQERRQQRARIAALQAQRDQVLSEKAAALEKALAVATADREKAGARRDQAISGIDTHNAGELARYTAEMGSVGTYAWVLSLGLLFLIAGLSYRCVRINVMSGIIPLRNYTVLDAHGSLPERIFTAFSDAINRRGLQFAVWIHRLLSPKQAITSFDGTVVAQPGTYNTPEGFHPPTLPAGDAEEDQALRNKVAAKIMREAAEKKVVITPEMLQKEFDKARTMNGTYKDAPLGEPKPSATSTPTPPAPAAEGDEARWVKHFRDSFLMQLAAYDQAVRQGNASQAKAHQDTINDPTAPNYRLGKRLGLNWGIFEGQIYVWRERTPWIRVPLESLTVEALNTPLLPAEPPVAENDDDLFKQNPNLFKQKIRPQKDETGKVIGIQYQKKSGEWTTYDYNTVKATWKIYQARADKGEVSAAVQDGLEKWEYALGLFDEGRAELENRFQEQVKTVVL